ncbi:hypothetical protein VDGD_01046 [Verticillium dahliae]|nr:hypothetical protein VDGD_01046 [Verticillium dahliae]
MASNALDIQYKSRMLRERAAKKLHPWNSPPSSTGSHGTITMSSVMSDPDGESTRKLNEDIARVTGPRFDLEAAHRKWPEHYGAPATKHNAQSLRAKENMPPRFNPDYMDDSTQDAWQDSKRTRAEMQPRVDNESDLSSTISKSPARLAIRPEMARFAHQTRTQSPLSRAHLRHSSGSQPAPSEAPLQDRISQMRRSHTSSALPRHSEPAPAVAETNLSKHTPQNLNAIRTLFPSPSTTDSPARNNGTMQSFVMPDISHLNDVVSGNLRLGGIKNGVPVFVKHGRVQNRDNRPVNDHAEVDGLAIPEDEGKIFVSMDMIREEIENLQQHDDMVQKYADDLQGEVDFLSKEVKRLKSRKSIDSALGSRSGSEPETAAHEQLVTEKLVLESQVNSLQTRLDQMTQKMGVNDVENNTLSLERDRALKKLQQACENIVELMDKLDAREKELNETQKKLDETLQLQTTQNVAPSSGETQKHQVDALQLENKSLRAENSTLRRDQQALQDEVESLRADNNSLRREQESLVAENRSLRTNARSLMSENEEFRENANTAQQELNAAREEVDALQQDMDAVDQEKITLKEDNDSLVRHNEKYFEENKMLRRENSGFERSIHDLHDENVRLKEEIEFLKQQLDHCRPLGKDDNFSARLGHDDEEEDGDEENMTSAFFVPDITIDENSIVDATTESNKAPPDMPTQSQRPFEIPEIDGPTEGSLADPENTFDTRAMKSRKDATQQKDMTTQGQKVAFSLPENAQNSKTTAQGANRSSKRRTAAQRSAAKGGLVADADAYMTQESTQDLTQNLSITFEPKAKSRKETTTRSEHTREHAVTMTQNMTGQSQKVTSAKSSLKPSHNKSTTVDITSRSRKEERPSETRANCPALSANARRVLDDLCEHKCKNCVVCSRITGHRGTVSLKEATEGKKRIHVPKPIPATEQVQQLEGYAEEPTMRPSQHPGQALAMVIKGLKDEAEHLKMEFSRLQARYNDLNSALGRTARKDLASRMREMLKRLEVKNDQIYALYDVLEGQKQADQAMPEEELEMTIFSITGLSLREASQNFTLDSVAI